MSKVWSSGTVVAARQAARLTAIVNGAPEVGKWVSLRKGSVGKVIGSVPTCRYGDGHRQGRVVYLVQFSSGIVKVQEAYLERLSDYGETSLNRGAMQVADIDLRVDKSPLESEPEY